MNIHEYQAKQLLSQYGIPIPEGKMVTTPQAALKAAQGLGLPVMVKVQVHAGGRGKAGGIKKAEDEPTVRKLAQQFLENPFKTSQMGEKAKRVRKLLIEKCSTIKHEYYAGVTLDRTSGRPVLLVSSEGGVDIEEIAKTHPDKLIRETVDPLLGFLPFQGRRIAARLGLEGETTRGLSKVLALLYRAYVYMDASMVEINPLVQTDTGEFTALDGKIVLDDNALMLHPELAELRDFEEEDKAEIEAKRFGLSYIRMDGSIGCMINGAGLAMATLDIITLHGMQPANFLDVGGSASSKQVGEAFQIILQDPRVRAVFVNIFGGIMQCEKIAEGIISAVSKITLKVPLVVRLEGTHVDLGRKLLKESGLPIISAEGIEDGVKKLKECMA